MPAPTTHQSTLILEAVKAALLNKTDAGTRVALSPLVTFRDNQIPSIAIWDPSEDVVEASWEGSRSPRKLQHEMVVQIQTAFKFNQAMTEISATANNFKRQIEAAMHADYTFGGVCTDSMKRSTTKQVDRDSDQFVLFMTVEYAFRYLVDAPEAADAQATDSLTTVDTRFSLNNAQAPADQLQAQRGLGT
jgi:hypothetical protein